jgi:hypothetical protein
MMTCRAVPVTRQRHEGLTAQGFGALAVTRGKLDPATTYLTTPTSRYRRLLRRRGRNPFVIVAS